MTAESSCITSCKLSHRVLQVVTIPDDGGGDNMQPTITLHTAVSTPVCTSKAGTATCCKLRPHLDPALAPVLSNAGAAVVLVPCQVLITAYTVPGVVDLEGHNRKR